MANEESSKRPYPYLAASMWASLRAALVKTAPRAVTTDYLQSALGISDKNAKNVHPQLRNLGIIDPENQLTDIGKDLRSDEHYPDACAKIVEAVYPDGLTDVFSEPTDEDLERIASWFMRNADSSQATSKKQARFYSILKSGKIPTADAAPKKRVSGSNGKGSASTPGKAEIKNPPNTNPAAATTPPDSKANQSNSQEGATKGLSLQLNLQIHISPESSTEQIDAIFASVRKHLNG